MHTCDFSPLILTLRDSSLESPQLLSHDMEAVNFGLKRWVVEATDHSVRLFLAFRPQLELLELFSLVHRLPIVVEDGCGVQWLGVHLVAVIAQSHDDGVWVEYDLYILRLFDVAIWVGDGE